MGLNVLLLINTGWVEKLLFTVITNNNIEMVLQDDNIESKFVFRIKFRPG